MTSRTPSISSCGSPAVSRERSGSSATSTLWQYSKGEAKLADDAGARIVKSAQGVGAGIAVAKGPWILALDPGVRLERGWETAVERHIEASRAPARFRLYKADGGWLDGLMPPRALAALFLKQAGDGRGGGFDANALRRLGGRRLEVRGAV